MLLENLLIFQDSVLTLEVTCHIDYFIDLLVSIDLCDPDPSQLLLQYLNLLLVIPLLDLEKVFLLL